MLMIPLYYRSIMRIKNLYYAHRFDYKSYRVPDERTNLLVCSTVISEHTAVLALVSQHAAL